MTPRDAVAARLATILGEDRPGCHEDAQTLADAAIEAYEAAKPQPMRTAKKDGSHILAWRPDLWQWSLVRCIQGQAWPSHFTKWQPLPPDVEED